LRRAGLVGLALVLAAPPAAAFVRSKTDVGGNPFFWPSSCVPVTIYLNGFTDPPPGKPANMSLPAVLKSITAAAHTWSKDAVTCDDGTHPFLEIVPTLAPAPTKPPRATDPAVHGSWDARNSIIFRTESWSRSGLPGHDFPDEALAVTTVTAVGDGSIVDADVEINAVSKAWFNFDPGATPPSSGHGGSPDLFDLQNALTHEFGHFIGFDHTCWAPANELPGKLRPTNDKGDPVPDCADAPGAVATTVMFNVTGPGEISQRFLADDDRRGVCAAYAAALDPGTCALDTAPPGCAVGVRPRATREPGESGGAAAVVAAIALGAARRRRASGVRG
jgi:hypothetical protein